MRLFLFDCDGTIADSFAQICGTMRGAFVACHYAPPSDETIHAIIGLSLPEAMLRLRPGSTAEQVHALVEAYRACFIEARAAGQVDEVLFPGMAEIVHSLAAADDNLLGIVTGKSRRGVDHVLARHGLTNRFQVVRTADDCPSKPHPAMVLESCAQMGVPASHAVVIGDAAFDMAMAQQAGATAIGVSWGAAVPEVLVAAGAHAVARNVAHLECLLAHWRASDSPAAWSPPGLHPADPSL